MTPAHPADPIREALAFLVSVLKARHHGRMPDEVRQAFDTAERALAQQPQAAGGVYVPAATLDDLRKFLDVAAGEYYEFDGVDAADLYAEFFGDPPAQQFEPRVWEAFSADDGMRVRVQPLSDNEIANALVSVGLDLGYRCNEQDIECARAIERALCAHNGLQLNETGGE